MAKLIFDAHGEGQVAHLHAFETSLKTSTRNVPDPQGACWQCAHWTGRNPIEQACFNGRLGFCAWPFDIQQRVPKGPEENCAQWREAGL